MIRFVFRFIGFLIFAAAFAALLYDGTKTIASNDFYITKLEAAWRAFHPTSFEALQPTIERYAGPWLWNLTQTLVEQPAWLVLGILGALLMLVGRKKKPLIGYSR